MHRTRGQHGSFRLRTSRTPRGSKSTRPEGEEGTSGNHVRSPLAFWSLLLRTPTHTASPAGGPVLLIYSHHAAELFSKAPPQRPRPLSMLGRFRPQETGPELHSPGGLWKSPWEQMQANRGAMQTSASQGGPRGPFSLLTAGHWTGIFYLCALYPFCF